MHVRLTFIKAKTRPGIEASVASIGAGVEAKASKKKPADSTQISCGRTNLSCCRNAITGVTLILASIQGRLK